MLFSSEKWRRLRGKEGVSAKRERERSHEMISLLKATPCFSEVQTYPAGLSSRPSTIDGMCLESGATGQRSKLLVDILHVLHHITALPTQLLLSTAGVYE